MKIEEKKIKTKLLFSWNHNTKNAIVEPKPHCKLPNQSIESKLIDFFSSLFYHFDDVI